MTTAKQRRRVLARRYRRAKRAFRAAPKEWARTWPDNSQLWSLLDREFDARAALKSHDRTRKAAP